MKYDRNQIINDVMTPKGVMRINRCHNKDCFLAGNCMAVGKNGEFLIDFMTCKQMDEYANELFKKREKNRKIRGIEKL